MTAVFVLRQWLVKRIRWIHAVSRHVARIVRAELLDSASTDRVVVIPDIVIAPGAQPALAVPPSPASGGVAPQHDVRRSLPAEPYILFVGALQPHKGLRPLVAAYQMLHDPPPLVLVGTRWPDTPTDIPTSVTVLSDLAHADVMRAWQGALFGVAPSIWPDPLPGVIREAMSAGRPVIGSRAGGIPDIIVDEQNGLLVEPGDEAGLAGAMARLIEDDQLRERLGARAMADVAEYDPASIAHRFG
ncbi:MAG: glycosyltransferase family 4 protein, partial [Chloroflexi bacterium]|nr:glycosyltransferase family 4 protein [Chloroflexota bacterium]